MTVWESSNYIYIIRPFQPHDTLWGLAHDVFLVSPLKKDCWHQLLSVVLSVAHTFGQTHEIILGTKPQRLIFRGVFSSGRSY